MQNTCDYIIICRPVEYFNNNCLVKRIADLDSGNVYFVHSAWDFCANLNGANTSEPDADVDSQ